MKSRLKPFIKWAGGKRQIMHFIENKCPLRYNRFIEPFVGAGSVFMNFLPNNAIINDINFELINIYLCIKNSIKELIEELEQLQKETNKEKMFYEIREWDRKEDWNNISLIKKAARFIFINKYGFNGLYRVNSKGYCNVPYGKKLYCELYDKKSLYELHYYLIQNDIEILNKNFEDCCSLVQFGDFVYFDPPYDESFTGYDISSFKREEQIRLFNCFVSLSKKGIHCLLSNHETEFIKTLYGNFNITIIQAKRFINCDGNKRGNVNEVLISNF